MFETYFDPAAARNSNFHIACQRGDLDAVTRLLDEGADVNNTRSDMPALLAAAHGQHWAIVRLLIERDAEVNCKNLHGWSPLHIAAEQGHEEMIRLMVENAGFVNRKDSSGESPLYVAAKANKLEACKILLELGADPRIQNKIRDTPMHCASRNGNEALAIALIEKGGFAHAENDAGETPISLSTGEMSAILEKAELERTSKQSVSEAQPDADGTTPTVPAETANPKKRKILKA